MLSRLLERNCIQIARPNRVLDRLMQPIGLSRRLIRRGRSLSPQKWKVLMMFKKILFAGVLALAPLAMSEVASAGGPCYRGHGGYGGYGGYGGAVIGYRAPGLWQPWPPPGLSCAQPCVLRIAISFLLPRWIWTLRIWWLRIRQRNRSQPRRRRPVLRLLSLKLKSACALAR